MEKDIPCKWKQKKAGVAIFISDKIDFKTKNVTWDKEGQTLHNGKGIIQEKDITFINIYTPNIGAPRYIKQILADIKGETDINTIIAGDFNMPITSMDRSYKQKINKEILPSNNTLEQIELIDMYRTFLPKTTNTFFSSAQGTFSRIEHVLGHKTSINKLKKTEIISSIFLGPQWCETRNLLQEENWKKHKYMETKQHGFNWYL